MAVIALPSFSKGVIGPSLHARVDTAMYRTGLRTARNCIIHPYGGVSNRPGSVCIGPVKDHTVSTTRLFRFHLGDTDQYVLEFGNLYMRVIRNDTHVTETATTVTAATQTNPVVITASSHGLSNGDEVVMNSIGGMVEISGGRYIVQATTTNTFELTNQVNGVNIDGTSFTAFSAGGSDTVAEIFELITPYLAADLSTLKMVQNANVNTITHPSYAPRDLTRTDHNVWTLSVLTYAPTIVAPTDLAAIADTNTNFQVFHTRDQTVRYQVTSIADTDEFFEESLAITVTLTDSSDPPFNTLTWTAESAAQRYGVYRQDNGLYGLIGETEDTTFIDDNLASELSISPPRARNPFTSSGDFPATSGYYEQRQIYGGTNNNPDTWYASQTGLRLNMSVSTPLQADDAITASLSSQDVQVIRHFVPLDDLIVLTNAGEWRINSGGDSHFSADTVKQKPQEFWGSDHMQPIIMGKTIFYVEDGAGRVRSLGFSLEVDGYQSSDMNLLANHLLVEDGPASFIVSDWTHQQFPEPRLYIVRSDGQILTMTFNKEQQVIAWTTWDTLGKYESITSLRRSLSNVEDGVYYIVQRNLLGSTDGCGGTDVRLIERMHTRKFANVQDSHFVDAGYRLDTQLLITNITDADPTVITSDAHGLSDGDEIEITDVNWCPTFDTFGNESNPTQFNNLRFTVANSTTNTLELLSHTIAGSGAWDITSITIDTNISTGATHPRPRGITLNSDGTQMVFTDSSDKKLYQWNLSVAYDIDSRTYSGVSFDPTSITGSGPYLGGIWEDSGNRFYLLVGSPSRKIYELSAGTPYDISTLTDSSRSLSVVSTATTEDFAMSSDGLKLYTAQNTGSWDNVHEWNLGTAWEIDSAVKNGAVLNLTNIASDLNTITFRPNGLNLFLVDNSTNKIRQFDLSTAWALSTAVLSADQYTVTDIGDPGALTFHPDGTVVWMSSLGKNKVHQYTMTVQPASVDVGLPSVEIYKDGGIIRKCITVVTGLHCIEGETVSVLLDGNVEPDYTVDKGQITIRDGRCITRASIGLPYITDIETLNIEVSSPPSTIQDKVKKITDVMIRFNKSRMPFIGPNNTDMVEMKLRENEKYGEETGLLTGDKSVNIPPSWNTNGRLFIRMRAPVPITILGLFPEMTIENDL